MTYLSSTNVTKEEWERGRAEDETNFLIQSDIRRMKSEVQRSKYRDEKHKLVLNQINNLWKGIHIMCYFIAGSIIGGIFWW